jgi:hypothetical protein
MGIPPAELSVVAFTGAIFRIGTIGAFRGGQISTAPSSTFRQIESAISRDVLISTGSLGFYWGLGFKVWSLSGAWMLVLEH